ncbi:putative multidrug resistance protein [Punica granatum]|uniref:Multidrug resistance protein n=1 Tax=Punica granatum TaxID=22663 RepID=A0A218WTP3_PUNGR|nr:putative multidrug resistance protein [Punica granatum]OWM76145.1 hypothetical protein CDL15_Pgr009791 [Punica granatum]
MGNQGGLFRFADSVDKLFVVLGTLGSVGDGLMSPLTMLVLSLAINDYGAEDASFSNEVVDKHALRLFIVAIFVGASAFTEGICWTRTAERQSSRIRMEYLKSVLRQEVGFLDSQDASSSTFRVVSAISSDAHSIQDVIAEKIPNSIAHVSSFIFSLVVAFMLSWRLALSALPFSLMFVIPVVGLGKLMMTLGAKSKEAYEVAGGAAEQAVSSIRTVYSYVAERQTVARFSNALQRTMELGIHQGFIKGLLIGSMGMVFAAWAFQAWVGSMLVSEKGEKGGTVFVAGICIIMGGLSIMTALPNLSSISEGVTASSRICEMIDRVPGIDSEDPKGKTLAYVRGDIEFKGVEFSYPSRPNNRVLRGLNLSVRAGTTVGLVGGSGSGKSTVISLLERFYDPVTGDIFLDGHKLKKLKLKWLRSQMGLVSQETILFATSIKENILFGKEGAPMELVVNAAKAANAHDFIMKLPDGYNTQVGQFGVQLSGGQKQRIAIARALIRDPRILLLDEATSALDAQSERIVQEALDQASVGRTAIVVAHRLSTIRKANLIAVLQSGKVVESGSHDELIKMDNGVYGKMVELQQAGIENEASKDPIYPTGNTDHIHQRGMSAQSPYSLTTVRYSSQGSPAYLYSPVFSISLTPSNQFDDYSREDSGKDHHLKSSQWRLLLMTAPEWKRAVLGCLGAVGFGAVQPVHAYCLGTVVSIYFLKDGSAIKSEIKTYIFIFLGLTVVSFITNLLQHYNFAIMGESLRRRVQEQMLEKILTFEVGWFDRDENKSAAICARLASEASAVRSIIADRMSLLIQVFCSATLAFVFGLIVTWRVAIVMIAMQPFLIRSFYSRSVLMKKMSERALKAQTEGCQLASEATIHHRTITAFSSQTRMLGLFQETLRGPRRENIKQSWFSGIGLLGSQFLTTASIALTYWYGGRLMNQGLVAPKHLFQAFFILMSTGKNIADAGSMMSSDIAKGSNAVKSVFAILDRATEIEPEDPEAVVVQETIEGRIELKNILFSYPARPDQYILNGLSLKIEAGKRVALVGQSGSGKSTIIALIERFYDPIKGQVLVDGQDIKSYKLRTLRSHIALVSQEPTLFAGTIRENIAYGKEDATEAELRKAAKLANAHKFISSMKDGYDTYCGERGVQLSGGQKQRIAIAQAILKNPAILLLDEATSALDSVSENLVQEAFEKVMVGRTCVIVAHRLSTIQSSDTIAVIKNGKVVEQGSHRELISIGNRGSYYSLIKLQGSQSP